MKKVKLLMVVMFLMSASVMTFSQTTAQKQGGPKTEAFKVWGNCGMCKDRIEKTAKAEGATTATWDVKTKMLTVSFDPSKTSKDGLSKKIASAGHDTEKFKAEEKTYTALPGCCHYERVK